MSDNHENRPHSRFVTNTNGDCEDLQSATHDKTAVPGVPQQLHDTIMLEFTEIEMTPELREVIEELSSVLWCVHVLQCGHHTFGEKYQAFTYLDSLADKYAEDSDA